MHNCLLFQQKTETENAKRGSARSFQFLPLDGGGDRVKRVLEVGGEAGEAGSSLKVMSTLVAAAPVFEVVEIAEPTGSDSALPRVLMFSKLTRPEVAPVTVEAAAATDLC